MRFEYLNISTQIKLLFLILNNSKMGNTISRHLLGVSDTKGRAEAGLISADLCSRKGHGIFNYHFPAKVTIFLFLI